MDKKNDNRNMEKSIEKNIKEAFEKATPDVTESILRDISAGVQIPDGVISTRRRRPIARMISAAAAVFLIISGVLIAGYFRHMESTAAIRILIDVNPSVIISANAKEEVLSVTPGNSDGGELIGISDTVPDTLESAVNSIVDAMLEQGYLSEESNSVLISVESRDRQTALDLRSRLTLEVSDHLREDSFNGAVVAQTVDGSGIGELAEEHGITEGKAQLIRRIIAVNGGYSFEELARLEITELTIITESENTHIEGIESSGSPSDKAYVGEENAVNAALDHAGLPKDDVDTVKANIDVKDGKVVYEIDLNYSGCDYGFMVNASDGSILKFSQVIVYESTAPAEETGE